MDSIRDDSTTEHFFDSVSRAAEAGSALREALLRDADLCIKNDAVFALFS